MLTHRVGHGRPQTPRSGSRLAALAVCSVLGLALLTGCGNQIGSAALIGDVAVDSSTIDAESTALSGTATDTLAAGTAELAARITQDRTLVTYAIWHQMLVQAKVAVPLTDEQIDQILADEQTTSQLQTLLLATPDTLHDRIADAVSMQQLVVDAIKVNTPVTGPKVDFEYLSAPDLSTALDDRTRYAADPTAWSAAVTSAAATSDGGSSTATALGTGVGFISTGVFTAQPGQIVVSASGSAYTLVKVTARTTESIPLDSTTVSQLGPADVNALGALLLSQRAGGLPPIQVNPRFGVWDAQLAQVVAAPAQL